MWTRRTRALCLWLAAAVCARGAQATDWPQWREPNRDGRSPDVGLLTSWPEDGPELLWKATGIGIGFSSAVVLNGTVYITGDIGENLTITALEMTGSRKWQVTHAPGWQGQRSPGSLGSPTVSGGKLYLLSGHGILKCYDAETGTESWGVDIAETFNGTRPGWGYSESPLVYRDTVIVTPGGRNCMVALDSETGETVWTSTGLEDEAHHASAIAVEFEGHPLVVQMTGKGMVGIDALAGSLLWRCERAVGGAACATPVCTDGYCFGATGYNNGGACVRLALDGGTVRATQVWDTKDMVCHHGGYVVHDGYIYGNHEAGWSCIDLATGEKKWWSKGVGKGSLCYADGMLYTLGESGGRMGLVRATPERFEQTGEFRVDGRGPSWAYPVVVGGRLYVRYHDVLYCFDVRAPGYGE